MKIRDQKDLERLARHVHKAPEGTEYGVIVHELPKKPLVWHKKKVSEGCFSISAILSFRDKLRGKPDRWVNDWATFRAQDSGGDWCEYETQPELGSKAWYNGGTYSVLHRGSPIGVWQETLEERLSDGRIVEHSSIQELFDKSKEFPNQCSIKEEQIEDMFQIFEEAACKEEYDPKVGVKALFEAGFRKGV